METRNSKKRKREDPPQSTTGVHISPRKHQFNSETWWQVDMENSSTTNQGATALVKRCMRNCGWSVEKTKEILDAYRQFLTLKKELEDWDATILSPSHLVDEMWHQHISDIGNYCHDMMLLCGRVVLHNPDGALDTEAKKKRDTKTRSELINRFGLDGVSFEVWNFTMGEIQTFRAKSGSTNDGKVMVRVKAQSGIYHFVINRSAKMVKLFTSFARHSGTDRSRVRFLLNGRRIREVQTAEELGLQDGDGQTIEVVRSDNVVSGPIVMKFTDQMLHEIYFKVLSTIRFGKVFKTYARIRDIRREHLRFLHCGVLLRDNDTPERLDMEDGNTQIDVEISRGGC